MGHRAILAIENRDLSDAIARAIKSMNISYDVVNDGIQAINSFDKNEYDFLIVDEKISRLNLKIVINNYKDKGNNKVIMLTFNSDKLNRMKSEYGCDEIISRPFTNDDFINVVNKVITELVERSTTND